MSIKDFVKEHSPDFMFALLKLSYKALKSPCDFVLRQRKKALGRKIIAEAENYRSHYQDGLSMKILSDRYEYLLTDDTSIFIRRAFSEGKSFREHYLYIDGKGRFSLTEYGGRWHFCNEQTPHAEEKYSGITVLYDDKKGENIGHAKLFMAVCEALRNYRLLSIDELYSTEIASNELIINAVSSAEKLRRAKKYIQSTNKNIYFVNSMLWYDTQNQYFDVFTPAKSETVIDVGAYDGKTALHFLEWGGEKIRKIYAFDFDPDNIAKCRKNLKGFEDKITLIEKGAWDKDEILHLDADFMGSGSSKVVDKGTIEVQLTAIDKVVGDEPVTFIKMDIEGSELKALMGVKHTITKNHPRLAISVYHKPEDISEIPKYILSLVPEYKFILRHYSSTFAETILYAYCGEHHEEH